MYFSPLCDSLKDQGNKENEGYLRKMNKCVCSNKMKEQMGSNIRRNSRDTEVIESRFGFIDYILLLA